MKRTLLALVLPLLLVASVATGEAVPQRTMDVRFDVTRPGAIHVEIEVRGVQTDRPFSMKRAANPEEYVHRNVRLFDGQGAPLAMEERGPRYVVEQPPDTVIARYEVVPGGMGRHGHQGYLWEDGVGFDGRVLLWPRDFGLIEKVRYHFDKPSDWQVAGAWVQSEDGWELPGLSGASRQFVMGQSCFAVGPYEERLEMMGNTQFRVYTHKSFPDGDQLAHKTITLMRWFHENQGLDPGRPWAQVWTPPGPSMAKVWSGAAANGSCYERPQKGVRNWQLLGHRLGHPLNEYLPEGYILRDSRDQWFMEGWASYVELEAMIETGLVPDQQAWNDLYAHHRRLGKEHPDWATYPLAREPESRGELREYLHYTKGPLAVRMIADIVEWRTGRRFHAFIRHVHDTHRRFAKPLSLREELEAWAEMPFDDVWEALVDGPGPMVPTWSGYASLMSETKPGALSAADTFWSGDQLFHFASTRTDGGMARLGERMQRAADQRRRLASRELRLVAPKVDTARVRMVPADRMALDQLEATWPDIAAYAPSSSGCGQDTDAPSHPKFHVHDIDGGRFLKLVKSPTIVRSNLGLRRIVLTAGDTEAVGTASVSGIGMEQPLRVTLSWLAQPTPLRVDLVQDDRVVHSRPVKLEHGWNRSWVTLYPDVFGPEAGIFYIRVMSGDLELGRAAVWRR